jgi:hypothetical protein
MPRFTTALDREQTPFGASTTKLAIKRLSGLLGLMLLNIVVVMSSHVLIVNDYSGAIYRLILVKLGYSDSIFKTLYILLISPI